MDQAAHFDMKSHPVDAKTGIRKCKGAYGVRAKRSGYEDTNEDTWKTVARIWEDMPGVLENYLRTAGEKNLKRITIDLCF